MNIEWNPDDPACRVRIPDGGVLRYMIYDQTPTGWTFSGLSYMTSDIDLYEYLPKPVCELLHAQRRLGAADPDVYFRAKSGEVILDDPT